MMIRSQNRMYLVALGNLYIQRGNVHEDATIVLDSGDSAIQNWVLGAYENVERCLEILDEIQSKYNTYISSRGGESLMVGGGVFQPFAFTPPKVYEMPEK